MGAKRQAVKTWGELGDEKRQAMRWIIDHAPLTQFDFVSRLHGQRELGWRSKSSLIDLWRGLVRDGVLVKQGRKHTPLIKPHDVNERAVMDAQAVVAEYLPRVRGLMGMFREWPDVPMTIDVFMFYWNEVVRICWRAADACGDSNARYCCTQTTRMMKPRVGEFGLVLSPSPNSFDADVIRGPW